jgi:hypothetical protein
VVSLTGHRRQHSERGVLPSLNTYCAKRFPLGNRALVTGYGSTSEIPHPSVAKPGRKKKKNSGYAIQIRKLETWARKKTQKTQNKKLKALTPA